MSKNVTVKQLSGNREVLLSYGTPVAAFIPGRGYVKTDERFSVTSSRHANQYCRQGLGEPIEVTAVDFNKLIAEESC